MAKMPITNVVSIYHHKRTANTEDYDTVPAYTNINACISPTGTDIQVDLDAVGSFQLFELFLYDVTVAVSIGDKIVTDANEEYTIFGSPNKFNNPYLHYIRCVAKQLI